jgi:hypothetical protein
LPVIYDTTSGYTLAYQGEDIQFPVYVVALTGVGLAIAAVRLDNVLLFGLALSALGFAYHNYPLLEAGRPRLGAGQYGIFAEGLGILSWRAIRKLEIVPVEVRGSMSNELRITLRKPLAQALLADWRHRQFHRFLMRLPWAMAGKDVIRIPLDVFDRPAAEIYGNFARMMGFYRN